MVFFNHFCKNINLRKCCNVNNMGLSVFLTKTLRKGESLDLAKQKHMTLKQTQQLTKTQKFFITGKKILAKLDAIERSQPLSAKESYLRDKVKQDLFASVVKFGMSEAHKRMEKYSKSSDAFAEVQQSLAAIFFQKLPEYDPTQTTPTTYFVPYFNQEISRYIRSYSQNLTQYDAKNVSLVRRAIQYYESKNIKWDIQLLSTRTGLSPKVVKKTLEIAENSQRANIEDAIFLQAKSPTPEESYINNERMIIIQNALHDSLDYEEMEFFLYRLNMDGDKERTYQAVAEHYNMQIRDVKKKMSSIITKLSNNKALQAYHYNNKSNTEKDVNVYLHDSSGNIMEHQIMGFILSNKNEKIQPSND